MPKHLRIVVGLMGLFILASLIFIGSSHQHMQFPRILGIIFGIIITIYQIRGFVLRSIDAWSFAKIRSICDLIVILFIRGFLVWHSVTPLKPIWLWELWPIAIAANLYTLWILFSTPVRLFFTEGRYVQSARGDGIPSPQP